MSLQDLPRTLWWIEEAHDTPAHLCLIDQRRLPWEFALIDCFSSTEVCGAIADLTVRGAPALGIAGAFALVLWANNEFCGTSPSEFLTEMDRCAKRVIDVRPTAVNLSWAVGIIRDEAACLVKQGLSIDMLQVKLLSKAQRLADEDEETNCRIGINGMQILKALSEELGRALRIETHCNAGSLATVRYGTALSAIYFAYEQGYVEKVWVDETRPVGQGARLTTWELEQVGVPYTLICDDMAGSLMAQGAVDAVIVGADRICENGDVANKIGTYPLAVLAAAHGVPFYVAAPHSTFDHALQDGSQIVIEQRAGREVRCIAQGDSWLPVAPQGCDVYNPAFDVTPRRLITEIITDCR